MEILLINPIIKSSSPNIYFPLGLGYISKILLQEECNVRVLDINAYKWTEEEVEAKIKGETYDIVCLTGLITEYKYIKWLSSLLKLYHPSAPIILGGGLASSLPQIVLEKTSVDIVVIGEGEVTSKELIHAFKNSSSLNQIKGIWFKEDGKIVQNPPREPIESLDEIPFPAWDLFPMDIYIKAGKLGFDGSVKSMNMITSRGCPYHCVYCYHDIFGYKFRSRSPANIIKEMQLLKDKYEVKGITFSDDTFVLSKKRVYEFCDTLKSSQLDMLWACNGRVNLMNEEMLKKMKDAGCILIGYGIESGSQKMLDAMKKQVSVEQAKKAIELTRKVGIFSSVYMIIGMIGEDETTVWETIKFCQSLGIYAIFSIMTPFPGTPLYQEAKKLGKIKADDEEKLLEQWGDWKDEVLVNLTTMSDERLIELKKEAENKIYTYIVERHTLMILKRVWNHYKNFGFKSVIKKVGSWIKRYLEKKQLK